VYVHDDVEGGAGGVDGVHPRVHVDVCGIGAGAVVYVEVVVVCYMYVCCCNMCYI